MIVLLCLCLAGVGYGWYSAPQNSPSGSRRTCAAAAPARGGKCLPPASTPSPLYFPATEPLAGQRRGGLFPQPALLRAYLTPACYTRLEHDFQVRRNGGELRERTRRV